MDKFEIHKAKVSDLHALKERQEKEIKSLLDRIDRTLEEYGKRVREIESFKEAFPKNIPGL